MDRGNLKIKFLFGILIISLFLCGCKEQKAPWKGIGEDNTIQIALLGNAADFEFDKGILDGMQYAADELEAETGNRVEFLKFEDEGEYNTGVIQSARILKDPSIAATISVQGFDILETVANLFEEEKRPLILTQGCYDRLTNAGYQYMITDFINAEKIGRILGKHALENGYRSVVYCHTDTEFEEDEVKGFQSAVHGTDCKIVDMVIGPFTQEEFDLAYERWELLSADSVCISAYSLTLAQEIAKMLKEKGSDIKIMTDYGVINDENTVAYQKVMEGMAAVPQYPYLETKKMQEFSRAFRERYLYEPSIYAIQSYELIKILGGILSEGVKTPEELMERIKSEKGHETMAGTIYFDGYGRLNSKDHEVLIFKNGSFKSGR